MTPRTRRAKMKLPFPGKLVLARWVIREFGLESFADLAEQLGAEPREGIDEKWRMSKAEMAQRHVLFIEHRATYVGEMLRRMGVNSG